MPGGSAAAAAAETLDQLMAKAEECRAAALKCFFQRSKAGNEKYDVR